MLNKVIFFSLILLSQSSFFAQLNCKTLIINSESVKTCLHKNGQKSTVETWDKDKRQGKFIGYDLNGKELFYYSLRTFGGHASVHVDYFPNGQVQKIEYSSAPDGGIQFYRDTRKFNETGEQIDFWKMDYPFETLTEITQIEPVKQKDTITKIEKPVETFIPYQTVFKIINTTGKKIVLDLEAQQNKWVKLNNKELIVIGNQTFTIDTVTLNKQFIEQNEAYFLKLSLKNKKSRQFQIILAQPNLLEGRKEYTWIIIKKPKL